MVDVHRINRPVVEQNARLTEASQNKIHGRAYPSKLTSFCCLANGRKSGGSRCEREQEEEEDEEREDENEDEEG